MDLIFTAHGGRTNTPTSHSKFLEPSTHQEGMGHYMNDTVLGYSKLFLVNNHQFPYMA